MSRLDEIAKLIEHLELYGESFNVDQLCSASRKLLAVTKIAARRKDLWKNCTCIEDNGCDSCQAWEIELSTAVNAVLSP